MKDAQSGLGASVETVCGSARACDGGGDPPRCAVPCLVDLPISVRSIGAGKGSNARGGEQGMAAFEAADQRRRISSCARVPGRCSASSARYRGAASRRSDRAGSGASPGMRESQPTGCHSGLSGCAPCAPAKLQPSGSLRPTREMKGLTEKTGDRRRGRSGRMAWLGASIKRPRRPVRPPGPIGRNWRYGGKSICFPMPGRRCSAGRRFRNETPPAVR